jgi:formate dehydrogenase subunit gamma
VVVESRAQDYAEAIARLLPARADQRGVLLPLLHALQEEFGYIDDAMVPALATALNLSRADIHGVVTFYHDFRRSPHGKHVLRLCRAESCQARGAVAVEQALTDELELAMGETSADGQVTLEAVYCLGLCATGPNAMIDDVPISRLDPARLDRVFTKLSA